MVTRRERDVAVTHVCLTVIGWVGHMANARVKVMAVCPLGRGPKMKNGPIDKILRIQLGLYIRKPGEKNLAHEKLILMRGIAVENLKTPIMGSKIKVVVNFIYGYQNLSGEKYKTNGKRISSIGLTS